MSDFFLSDAAFFFFAAWIAIIAGLGITAFGRDLLTLAPTAETPQNLTKPASGPPNAHS